MEDSFSDTTHQEIWTRHNYCAVINLPFVSKLVERTVVHQDGCHIKTYCPLPICTSAYREGHSTESALLKVPADILHNMEAQKVTLLILIDLSAAFDTLDHDILITRLQNNFGITGLALEWHKSYLSGRRQCINLNGTHSQEIELKYGVPQGSCLGPVLFTEYTSTLFDTIYSHLNDAHGYADDHTLYLSFSSNSLVLQEVALSQNFMESCLLDVRKWMLFNKLKQQLDKVQISSIRVGDSVIKAVDSVRNLGAYFESILSIGPHIDAKCGAAFRQLFSIRRIRRFLTREATETLIHAFIFSHLDYCNAHLTFLRLWSGKVWVFSPR